MGWRRISVGLGAAIAVVVLAGPARAGEVEPLERIPVQITGSAPGISVRVVGSGVDVACGERCETELPPGRYGLVATGPDGRGSARTVHIRTPSRITVTPHNHTARVTGLVLAPIGVASIAVSAGLFWWAGLKVTGARLAGCNGDECTAELPDWLLPAAFVALGTGVALGVTGLILWRTNAHAGVDMTPLAERRPDQARLRLLPTAGPRGGGLALVGSF